MTKPKTLVVTIAGMISEKDLLPLRDVSEVDYCELDSITEGQLAERCSGYDYLMLNMDVLPRVGSVKLTEAFYASPAVRKLKTIAVDMTGVDYFNPKAATSAGVMLQNIPHYSTRSVAESVLAEVLLHSRQRHLAYVDEIRHMHIQARKGINLLNRTAGIVGYGSIGSVVSNLLTALGMHVVVWSRSPKAGVNQVSLEALFERSDVICISLPTIKEGHGANIGVINADLLQRCRGTIVVNLANELLINTEAISAALTTGKVAGYSVEASPELRATLSVHPNVHFAPANAWSSDESMQTLREVWVGNVLSLIAGRPQNVYRE